jgi:hypothetical protein
MQPETSLQIACLKWWAMEPRYKHLQGLLFMITNDGAKSKQAAVLDKARGLIPGIPDLFLSVPNGMFHGLYIELKAGKGKVNKVQEETHKKLKQQGYKVQVVRDVEKFKEVVEDYLYLGKNRALPIVELSKYKLGTFK